MTEIFIVFLYCDYRKEVNIQHLKAFKIRQDAIDYARKYSDTNNSSPEYALIRGTEYDASLYGASLSDDDIDDDMNNHLEQIKRDLQIKHGMWYMRIAVDKVTLE
jgi:hypothetical protein